MEEGKLSKRKKNLVEFYIYAMGFRTKSPVVSQDCGQKENTNQQLLL
jgi:hypothetical protein